MSQITELTIVLRLQKCFGQALFLIRACAIWSWNRCIVAFLSAFWLVHLGVSLINLGLDKMFWLPDPILPGYGVCVTNRYAWPVGASYAVAFALDLCAVSLAAYKLMQIRQAARSSFWTILLNDGISWCLLTLAPTLAAILCFYLGRTVPVQSTALVISSTMHAILACKAYRKLSDFAETLPPSFCPKEKVANGTMLDPDTLARLAWMSGSINGDLFRGNESHSATAQQEKESSGKKQSILGHVGDFFTGPRRPISRRSSSISGFSKVFRATTPATHVRSSVGNHVTSASRKGSVASTANTPVGFGNGLGLPSFYVVEEKSRKTPHQVDSEDTESLRGNPGLGLAGVQIITHSATDVGEIDSRAREMGIVRGDGGRPSRLVRGGSITSASPSEESYSQRHQIRYHQRRPETSRGLSDVERHHHGKGSSFDSSRSPRSQQHDRPHAQEEGQREGARSVDSAQGSTASWPLNRANTNGDAARQGDDGNNKQQGSPELLSLRSNSPSTFKF